MRIGIFTPRSIKPLHPRLAAFLEYFEEKGLKYDLIGSHRSKIFSRINWISLFFFDNWSIFKNRKKIKDYDIVIINDLRFLPLASKAKRHNKTVIYETIDNNVALRSYSLRKKIPFTGLLMNSIIRYYSAKERMLSSEYCDETIVNSRALREYFNNKAELLFYYSSFEDVAARNDPAKKTALLYLGEFSEEKGAREVLVLRDKLDVDLFIFGSVRSEELRKMLNTSKVFQTERISQAELREKIIRLFDDRFLAGVSFIRPVHISYATQEANKDIDYLALGIPLIGNHRLPTKEKIEAGCGIFAENGMDLNRLMQDDEFKKTLSLNSKDYYHNIYSKEQFRKGLDRVFGKYIEKC
jgi:hypothetical protein